MLLGNAGLSIKIFRTSKLSTCFINYVLLPIFIIILSIDPSVPCALICKSNNEEVKDLNMTVSDGTTCDNLDSFGVCVNGSCKVKQYFLLQFYMNEYNASFFYFYCINIIL